MRLVVIVFRLAPLALAFWRDYRRWFFAGAPVRRTAADHDRRADRLVRTLAELGPTFVKMAQLFAGRSDLLALVRTQVASTVDQRARMVSLPARRGGG